MLELFRCVLVLQSCEVALKVCAADWGSSQQPPSRVTMSMVPPGVMAGLLL